DACALVYLGGAAGRDEDAGAIPSSVGLGRTAPANDVEELGSKLYAPIALLTAGGHVVRGTCVQHDVIHVGGARAHDLAVELRARERPVGEDDEALASRAHVAVTCEIEDQLGLAAFFAALANEPGGLAQDARQLLSRRLYGLVHDGA